MGCARNDVDSEELAARMEAGGFRLVDDPAEAEEPAQDEGADPADESAPAEDAGADGAGNLGVDDPDATEPSAP